MLSAVCLTSWMSFSISCCSSSSCEGSSYTLASDGRWREEACCPIAVSSLSRGVISSEEQVLRYCKTYFPDTVFFLLSVFLKNGYGQLKCSEGPVARRGSGSDGRTARSCCT